MPKIRRQSFQQEFPFDLTRDFAVARLKMAGHNQFLAVAFRARKPQPCAFPVAAVVSAAICAVASIDDAGLLSIRRRYRKNLPAVTNRVLQPKIALLKIRSRKFILILIAALSAQLMSVVAAGGPEPVERVSSSNTRHVVLVVWDG